MPPTDDEDSNKGRGVAIHKRVAGPQSGGKRKGWHSSTMEEGEDDKFYGDNGNNLTVPLTIPYARRAQRGTRCCSKGTSLVGKGGGEEKEGTKYGVVGRATLTGIDS